MQTMSCRFPPAEPDNNLFQARSPCLSYCAWAKSCTTLRPLFIGTYKNIIIPGFLRWCRKSSIHIVFFVFLRPFVCSLQEATSLPCVRVFAAILTSPTGHEMPGLESEELRSCPIDLLHSAKLRLSFPAKPARAAFCCFFEVLDLRGLH